MTKAMKPIKSEFAIVDVKKGRRALAKHFIDRPRMGTCPPHLRIPVTITGYIDGIHSRDDGVSQEFSVDVTQISVGTL